MENVINKLSEIEHTAASIMEEATIQKKIAAADINQKIADFDAKLNSETEKQLMQLKQQMDERMQQQLAEQKQQAENMVTHLESLYANNHQSYALELFNSMIGR